MTFSQCFLQFEWTQQVFVWPWVPIFSFREWVHQSICHVACKHQWVPKRQKLIVRMFCSIDSMLWLLNTYLKYQQNLFLCFDIWTSYIMPGKHFDSHTSTCQSWKIRHLFFLQNCFMPVSKYQVTMVIATLVNRATLPPYRSKCNTKGRQNKLWNRGQKSLGKIPTVKEIKAVPDQSLGRWQAFLFPPPHRLTCQPKGGGLWIYIERGLHSVGTGNVAYCVH